MDGYYDRYQSFTDDGKNQIVPYLEIEKDSGDLYITYNRESMRIDNLSYKFYNSPNYGFLILLANSRYNTGLEFEIPNGVTLRIPYPLSTAIQRYEKAVSEYKASHPSE